MLIDMAQETSSMSSRLLQAIDLGRTHTVTAPRHLERGTILQRKQIAGLTHPVRRRRRIQVCRDAVETR